MKLSSLKRSFFLLVFLVVITNGPMISDILLPKLARYIPIFFVFINFILIELTRQTRNSVLIVYCILVPFILIIWALLGMYIFSTTFLLLFSVFMILVLNSLSFSQVDLRFIFKVWDNFVKVSIVSTLLSYLVFNLFGKIGFSGVTLGNYSDFNTFLNPLLGVISERNLLVFKIGRPVWFMTEPSYLGFFHGLNIFWIFFRKEAFSKYSTRFFLLSILALFLTFSLGAWVALILSILFTSLCFLIFFLFDMLKLKLLVLKRIAVSLLILFGVFFFYSKDIIIPVSDFIDNYDKYTSLEDRSNRMEVSISLIKGMDLVNFFIGYGPGTIETISEAGESNGWIKYFIELGLIPIIIYLIVLVRMFFRLKFEYILLLVFICISFNSVVIMFSPIVLLYMYMLGTVSEKKSLSLESF